MTWLMVLLACQEFSIKVPPPVEPAEPPGKVGDDEGQPPDWADCWEGFHGEYSNLSIDDPYMAPRERDEPAPTHPDELPFWDETTFQQFDATLDFGSAWWPVDEGLEGDPAYFAVRWRGWVRAWSGTDLSFTLGSSDDAWVIIDGQEVAALPGVHPFDPQTLTTHLDAGQYPIEILYAHRSGDSGFRFRVLDGDVTICYPEWDVEGAR